ncbi:hypothetical protein [Caulobacter phage BL94]|nr:hypothetical protein [Caulobacter phage BL94]
MAKGSDITHATAGRINIELGENSIDLRLVWWETKPTATLSFDEAEKLADRLKDTLAKARKRRKAEDDDFRDLV